MKLTVVIPAYNEAENLSKTISDIHFYIQPNQSISDYEFIICDDHSNDGTEELLKDLSLKYSNHFSSVRLGKRSGSHVSIKKGMQAVDSDLTLVISADGQEDPTVLTEMIDQIKKGASVVWGVRNSRDESWFSTFSSKVFYGLLGLFAKNKNNIDIANADFYLMNRLAIEHFNKRSSIHESVFGIVMSLPGKHAMVGYDRKERRFGKSKWSIFRKIRFAIGWISSERKMAIFESQE